MNMFLLVAWVIGCAVGTLEARRARRAPIMSTQEEKKEREVSSVPDIDRLTGQYRDIDALVAKAKSDAEYVKRTAEREKEALDNKVRRQQSRLERRREELLRKDAEQQLRLEQQVREEAAEAERKAQEKAAAIVRDAERKAAELKVVLQEQESTDRLAGRPAITKEWRRETVKDFEKDAAFIRQIVMEGEVSRIERQNFMALFTQQHSWFSEKVAAAEFFFDEAYTAVIAKKNSMAAVVDAQRQADDLILDLVQEYHFSAQVQSQLRLMALYEINNHLEHTETETLFLSSDVIVNLVNKISIDIAPGQRAIHIVSEKEKVAKLEARIVQMQEKMDQLQAVADTAVHNDGLAQAADMTVLQEEMNALKRERDEIVAQQAARDAHYSHERRSLVAIVEQKQREKAELEVKLSQIAEHMKILTTRSQDRLMALAQQVSDKKVTQDQLTHALESKARRQAELEISLAQVNEQITHLRKKSSDVIQVLTQQIAVQQDRCTTLGQLLEQKQQEGVALELEVRKLQELNTDALNQATAHVEQLERTQNDCIAQLAQIEQLQHSVAVLGAEKESATHSMQTFAQQMQSLIAQSQEQVGLLQLKVSEQEQELAARQKAYAKMEKLQKKLEKIRQKRELDVKNAASHHLLLSQMATFGDTLLYDYNRLHAAAENAREITKELAQLLSLLKDCQQEPDHAEVVHSLECALQLLSETSTALHNLPASRQSLVDKASI